MSVSVIITETGFFSLTLTLNYVFIALLFFVCNSKLTVLPQIVIFDRHENLHIYDIY